MRYGAALLVAACAALAACDAGLRDDPAQPGVEGPALDWSADPCSDFYQFACGNWARWHGIESDAARRSRTFDAQAAQTIMIYDIVAGDAANPVSIGVDPYADKIGNYYRSCTTVRESFPAGVPTFFDLVEPVTFADLPAALATILASFHDEGVPALFSFDVGPDPGDPTREIIHIGPGGFGMPRAYFVDADQSSVRAAYQDHIQRLSAIALSESPVVVDVDVGVVFSTESDLATASLDPAMRDPHLTYRLTTQAELAAMTPHFDWSAYLSARGVATDVAVNVEEPAYMAALDAVLARATGVTLQDYLIWRLIEAAAPALGAEADNLEYQFHTRTFYGDTAPLPAWWTCFLDAENDLGFAIARPFVAATFGTDWRDAATSIVEAVRSRMADSIATRPWLDDATRAEAQAKLGMVLPKIGFPDAWPSYDAVETVPDDYLRNRLALRRVASAQALAMLGQPTDRAAWLMPPIITNAYYSPERNDIVFPAAILQPPFFSLTAPAAANYGAIGSVMGHELTHGFDDQGRQFDGIGTLRDWWSPDVAAQFAARAACLVDQFGAYQINGQHVDGNLTLGENIADLGGLKLAYAAFQAADGGRGQGAVGLFSPEQEFFLAFAQDWCQKDRAALDATLLRTDPHSPARFRVNGTVANVAAFASAFHCPAGAPLAPVARCEIW
jgi:endothelin-converting enzyme/putative endopeptidase